MAAGRIPTTANSPLTVKGDLFTFSTGSAKLAVGANDTALVADSAQATGLAYKTKGVFNGLTTTGDTIYSSSGTTQSRLGIGSTGQVLTVASGIPSWATPATSASGLTFISGATFTSVAAVSAPTSSFTSTYTNYKVIFTLTSAPTDALTLRLRASGSDNTTSAYYTGQNRINYSGTRSDYGGSGLSSINLGTTSSSPPEWTQYTLDFRNPQVALQTTINIFGSSGSIVSTTGVGAFNGTTAFDAFSIIIASSTISGNYRIYGYQNS